MVYFVLVHVANGWQASSYGPPYGQRPPTVPTVNPTATLKTVGATPARPSYVKHLWHTETASGLFICNKDIISKKKNLRGEIKQASENGFHNVFLDPTI